MQGPGSFDAFEFPTQPCNALADQPTVDFELAFAGAAQKAKTAALTLQMGPRSHEARALIRERRQFDLETPLMSARPFAKNLENKAGAVDDLCLPTFFEIALLYRRQ